MPIIEQEVDCPLYDSFRVQQIAGMFDVPLREKLVESFRAEIPGASEPWQIGLIVGRSGSGKSTLARRAFGDCFYDATDWPSDRAVIDAVGELPTREITRLFTAVGFSSPPSWIKPYRVLSGGERFRCDLARALAGAIVAGKTNEQNNSVVAFDEFTSVVDRTVAKIGSAAIAKGIRGGQIGCRFVAVSCHADVAEWLEPDWVVDMSTGACQWRRLRRPSIQLQLFRCKRAMWTLFARHHYLSGSLSAVVDCFVATLGDAPVAFCAATPVFGRRGRWRITRVVTLPDYQGVGVGMKVAEGVAQIYRRDGKRMNITASHPSVVAHCSRSANWKTVSVKKTGSRGPKNMPRGYRGSAGRAVASFEYLGTK